MSERDIADALYGGANDNGRGPVSREAIEQDPWHAVDLPLPQDADRSLLEQVALAAGECAKAAFAAARVAAITDPDRAEPYGARQWEAADRWHEARRALRAVEPEQVSDVLAVCGSGSAAGQSRHRPDDRDGRRTRLAAAHAGHGRCDR